jgi:AcrR family transcriptional regulator
MPPEHTSPIPRPRGLNDDLRARVFEASMAVFAEHGFEVARMEQVAELAGVARGTLYYHFRTKADLFHFALHHGMELHARYVRDRVELAHGPRERLDALIDAYVDFYVEHASFTRVAILETARLRTDHDVGPAAVLGDLVAVTAGVLTEARQAGLLKELDPDICLSAFLGLVSSVPMFYASFHGRLPTNELKVALRMIFLSGVLGE